MIKVLLLKIF